jgi:hypothetical protein
MPPSGKGGACIAMPSAGHTTSIHVCNGVELLIGYQTPMPPAPILVPSNIGYEGDPPPNRT